MKLRGKLRVLFRKEKAEAEMAEELRSHIEQQTHENIARGMSPDQAWYAAQREFGGVEQIKERCRDERRRGFVWLEQLLQDLRYAARSLARNPGFTSAVVLTLALGIGANATIFSVVNAVVLKPLPYADTSRLVNLRETRPEAGSTGNRVAVPVSPATYFDWRNEVRALEEFAAVSPGEVTFTGEGEPEQIASAGVSANFFPLLGVAPRMGRNFRPEENNPGAEPVALLSHGFWQRRFGSSSSVLGQAVTINGERWTIVGVLPAWFDGVAAAGVARNMRPEVWVPLRLVEAGAPRSVPSFDVHARLRAGATLASAQGEIDVVMQRLAKEFPETNSARGGQVEPLVDRVVGNVRPMLWLLLAAVGLVLSIACANIANLLLARASLRSAETAMRAALGASRSRLIRQFLTESLLLAAGGGALGMILAIVSIDALVPLLPASLPRVELVTIDGRVLWFTALVSLLTGVAFGLAPAWQSAKTDLQAAIKTMSRGHGSLGGIRVRQALVVTQVALSLVLLVGAGLLLKSFATLMSVDPGFDPRDTLTLRFSLVGEKYPDGVKQAAFYEQIVQQVQTLPGVESAAIAFPLPFVAPIQNRPFSIPGRPVDLAQELSTQYNVVSPGYFHTLGIRFTQGRPFTERDREDAPFVAIVNETLARRLWPDENPIGKKISAGFGRPSEREIVGVIADIKQRQLDSDSRLQINVPYRQQPLRSMYLAVRTRVPPATLLPAVRRRIATLDRDLPFSDVALLSERVVGSIAQRRFTMALLAGFAATALLLAVVGLYGVLSYTVTQRSREFGIRMALGARLGDVLRLVVGQGMRLVFTGLAGGVLVSLGLTQVLSGLLFGVQPTDPITFVTVSLVLAAVGALACYLPARRATKVDPVVALRAE